jgi:nitroreductase
MAELLAAIEKRQSTRLPYDPARRISREHLKAILDAARWSPTAHNMQNFEIVVVQDRKLLELIASIPGRVSEKFVRENYAQLSFSEEELKRKKAGILGTMFPESWRRPGSPAGEPGGRATGGRPAGPTHPREENRSQARLVEGSAALLVVLYDPARRAPASAGDFLGIMSLGCVMQSMWLEASSLGIGFQILSGLSAPATAREVKRLLAVPKNLMIAFTARLGYPRASAPYLRVRRDVEDFAFFDRYGGRDLT